MVVSITFVLLVAAELGARVLLPHIRSADDVRFQFADVWAHTRNPFHVVDRDLFWRPIPRFSEGLIAINADGFRGPGIARGKDSRTYRIVALGDSVTFGYKVADSDTYVRQLERLLQPAAESSDGFLGRQRVEVINAGVVGYSSWQGRLWYERHVRTYAPDLLIVQFGYNDHHSAEWSDRQRYNARYLQAVARPIAGSALFRLAARTGNRIWGSPLPRRPVSRVRLDQFASNLLALQEDVRRDGGRCLFLITPVRTDVPLVENFRAIDFEENGRPHRVWMRQIDFAVRMLGAGPGREVASHFLGSGAGIGRATHDDDTCRRVQALSAGYPEFAVFHYLEAKCAAARGDSEHARAALARSASVDSERRELEAYFQQLRHLADERRIELLDISPRWSDDSGLLFDVIHPNARGHAVVAKAIAHRLLTRTTSVTRSTAGNAELLMGR